MSTKPYYQIPFDDVGAAYIGHFIGAWSQVEYFMTDCTAKMLGIEAAPAIILSENMTAGPKYSLFCRLAKLKITDDDTLKILGRFRSEMGPLIEKRNHILHGIWGYWVAEDYSREDAAVMYPRAKPSELALDELPAITEHVAAQTHNIMKIRQHLYGQNWPYDSTNPPCIRFSKSPPNRDIGETEFIRLSELMSSKK